MSEKCNLPFLHKCVRLIRRPIILLEVLIALALIALCALPLITPHVAMLTEQKKFVSTMRLDHQMHLLYTDVLEQLHLNRITWNLIQDHVEIPIDDAMWLRIGEKPLPNLKGSYRFEEIKHKSNDDGWSAYLLKLVFIFDPISPRENDNRFKIRREFPHTVYVLRHAAEPQMLENEKNDEKTEKKENDEPKKI